MGNECAVQACLEGQHFLRPLALPSKPYQVDCQNLPRGGWHVTAFNGFGIHWREFFFHHCLSQPLLSHNTVRTQTQPAVWSLLASMGFGFVYKLSAKEIMKTMHKVATIASMLLVIAGCENKEAIKQAKCTQEADRVYSNAMSAASLATDKGSMANKLAEAAASQVRSHTFAECMK